MGFDISGIDPAEEPCDNYGEPVGQYFRMGIMGWPPMWKYFGLVADDVLSDHDLQQMRFNNNHEISADKAEKLADRIEEALGEDRHGDFLDDAAHAAAQRSTERSAEDFPYRKWLREFAQFARHSGGFVVG